MSRKFLPLAGACAVLVLAGCANREPPQQPPAPATPPRAEAPEPIRCTPVAADDPMVGTWYSVSRPRGYAGDFQSLTVLRADGTMTYETQLKVGRRTRPALRESGCWSVAQGIYTLQTTQSNGEPVDPADPIYVNRYQVEKLAGNQLRLRELKSGGQVLTARRMRSGYRLSN